MRMSAPDMHRRQFVQSRVKMVNKMYRLWQKKYFKNIYIYMKSLFYKIAFFDYKILVI